jgi:CRISPR system CASCADE complex protein casB
MSDYTAQDELQRFVVAKVMRLYHQKSNGVSAATAQLAQLRRGVGVSPFQYPELLGIILEKEDGTEGIPEQYRGRGEQPSNAESAAYTALTLFALHQQSQNQPMHDAEVSFGNAVGKLVGDTTTSMKKRFDSLLTAQTENARQHYLRSLITLLRSEGIAFDYGRFAVDYMRLLNPATRQKVMYRWNRDFSYGLIPVRAVANKTTK